MSVRVPLAPAPIKSESLMAQGCIVRVVVTGVVRLCMYYYIYLLIVSLCRFSSPHKLSHFIIILIEAPNRWKPNYHVPKDTKTNCKYEINRK